jgi:hypothetical protein
LNVFSKLGTVIHEPQMITRPDLHFVSAGSEAHEFIADIVTVSDKGVDERFPIQALSIRFGDIIYKRRLKIEAFSLFVGSEVDNTKWPRPNPRLKIPHLARLDSEVFNEKFFEFLDTVSRSPEEPHIHVMSSTTPSVDIRITYDPSQKRTSTVWPAYNELKSLVRNTVYSRLEEKAGQLAKATYSGHRAILVCDGGCNHLSTTRYCYEDHIDDVFKYFLRQHPEIDFIISFVVQEALGNAERTTTASLYSGESFAQVGSEIKDAIERMGQFLPEAERSATNA